tara:strand:+ start:121 stop:480 length:360 start_codon:yes stop_codon:yes gene_type:complete
MTKNEKIINIVYNRTGIKLNKAQLNLSTINQTGEYSVEPNFKRKLDDWHLVLINTRQKIIFIFIIPKNHNLYSNLYKRNDKSVYRLIFDVNDMNFREKLRYERFDKYLIAQCEYNENNF